MNNEDLSFKSQKLLTDKHRIHPYPAMMHPSLVNHLLTRYSKPADVVFDPFCGSGSVLVGALEKGLPARGFDINPLALLIATAKTTQYDHEVLQTEIRNFLKEVKQATKSDIPNIKNISFWYADSIVEELGKVRYVLLNRAFKYLPFFVTVFAHTCRISSYTRNQEFKRYREEDRKRKREPGFVLELIASHINNIVPYYLNDSDTQATCDIRLANSAEEQSFDFNFDLVLTSPPYGDHSTTVAYGQYSSFANEWTSDLNPFNDISYTVDSEGLGKRTPQVLDVNEYPFLAKTLNLIETLNPKRAKDVFHFFNGYLSVLRNIVSKINEGGVVCFVVGNRRVAGIEIPLDQITAEIFDHLGLTFIEIASRKISNKVMPLQNSPSNVTGKKEATMTSEYVVVFQS